MCYLGRSQPQRQPVPPTPSTCTKLGLPVPLAQSGSNEVWEGRGKPSADVVAATHSFKCHFKLKWKFMAFYLHCARGSSGFCRVLFCSARTCRYLCARGGCVLRGVWGTFKFMLLENAFLRARPKICFRSSQRWVFMRFYFIISPGGATLTKTDKGNL